MSRAACLVAGFLLITVPTIEFGGRFLLTQILGGVPEYLNDPARAALLRAGHGHAGVLVILALWAQWAIDHLRYPAWLLWSCRLAFALAAVTMSAGFFATAAALETGSRAPSTILYVGATLLALGSLTTGFGLIARRRA